MLAHLHPVRSFLLAVAITLFGTSMAAAQSVRIFVHTESMTLASPMTAGNDSAAIGGRYISVPSGASTTNPVRSAHVHVNVPAGTYYLWARIAGATMESDALYVGIDASFDRVFPSAPGPYQWVRVETSDGSAVHGFALGDGNHILQVGHGEIGARLDALYLTDDSAEVPGFVPVRLAVEAESFNRVAPMTVGAEATAMAGQYLSPSSGTTSTSPVRSADAQVNVPIPGTYYLWARIAGPTMTSDALYVGIDTSFDRVFPSAQGPYQWVRVETSDGSAAHGFALAGAHIIQVGYGEIGAKLDAVYLTDNALEVPSFGPLRLTIEAEMMTLIAPVTVGSDTAASGGQYVSATSGSNSSTPVREAWATFTVPSTATYYLWARVWGQSSTSDALYVGINASFDRAFPSVSGQYQWVRVETTDGSAAHGFALGAGSHTLQVGHGEIGARLDALYVTDNAGDAPGGSAPPPPPPPPPPSSDLPGTCAIPSGGYEGFGGRNTTVNPARLTTGGAAFANAPHEVTRLTDEPDVVGTLRHALSQGSRCIVFKIAGTIRVNSPLNVRSNVTIDGFTAPSPGITLEKTNDNPQLDVNKEPPVVNISGVSNVVVRGIRIRNSPGDAIRVVDGASFVVLDHVSVTGFADGAIDVVQDAHDVTIQWSILGNGKQGHNFVSLLANNGYRVSVHHNLYINGDQRQPKCGGDTRTTPWKRAVDLVCDVRNNVIWNYTTQGTAVRQFGTGNVVNNYYKAGAGAKPDQTIWVTQDGLAYVSGNISQDNYNVDTGNRPEFSAIVPAFTDARTAALAVKGDNNARTGAGARGHSFGRDTIDEGFANSISIPIP